jgi:choline dehydrogenase-like flavoprotein
VDNKFDLIVVGTGFASSFFLYSYLKKAGPSARILVLERGPDEDFDTQLEMRAGSSLDDQSLFRHNHPHKIWRFSPGFGGTSKSWWACTPRFMPNDFRLRSVYGVGKDWPISYDDLEPYYCEAEQLMAVSGPNNSNLYPRSMPYPQPPHIMSDPDKILAEEYPGLYYPQPSARARMDTSGRSACCAIGTCSLCPTDSKFTILNGLWRPYRDSRLTLKTEAQVLSILTTGDSVTGVEYLTNGESITVKGDMVVLGAGSIFNPHILLRSGIDDPMVGKNLHEQVSIKVYIDLDGVDNYQGSTSITGHGYMLYDGEHRRDHAACGIESISIPHYNQLRAEKGKWRQRMVLKFIYEDLPDPRNHVKVCEEDSLRPEVVYVNHSDYAQRALDKLPDVLPDLLSPLPVEKITIADRINRSDGHIIGTAVMGNDPESSVVDKHLKHHRYRNLLVLGSGSYPASSPANPALTLSALSLWAAEHL